MNITNLSKHIASTSTILCLLSAFSFPAAAVWAETMSVEETIQHSQQSFICGISESTIARANPDALPLLTEMLYQNEYKKIWVNIVSVVGAVGKNEQVAVLVKRLHSFHGPLDTLEASTVRSIPRAIGEMASRDIPDATKVLANMSKSSYWNFVDYTFPAVLPHGYPSMKDQMIIQSLFGASRLTDEGFEKHLSIVKGEINTDNEFLKHDIASAKSLREYFQKKNSPEVHDHKFDQKNVLDGRKQNDAEENMDPAKPLTDVVAKVDVKKLRIEAILAYREIRELLYKKNYDRFFMRVLDDGVPIFSPAISKEDQQNLLNQLKLHIQALNNSDLLARKLPDNVLQESPIHVNVSLNMINADTFSERIVVKIAWPATREIVNNITGQKVQQSISINDDGDAVLYMVKLDGIWMWNPIGW